MRMPGSDQHQGSCRGCRGLAGRLAAVGSHGRFRVAQLCWFCDVPLKEFQYPCLQCVKLHVTASSEVSILAGHCVGASNRTCRENQYAWQHAAEEQCHIMPHHLCSMRRRARLDLVDAASESRKVFARSVFSADPAASPQMLPHRPKLSHGIENPRSASLAANLPFTHQLTSLRRPRL